MKYTSTQRRKNQNVTTSKADGLGNTRVLTDYALKSPPTPPISPTDRLCCHRHKYVPLSCSRAVKFITSVSTSRSGVDAERPPVVSSTPFLDSAQHMMHLSRSCHMCVRGGWCSCTGHPDPSSCWLPNLVK